MTQDTALSILKLGHTTFLTGAAGAGKSHVIREYVAYLRKHGVRYAITASTGIASTHVGGVTIHSWSGIGVKDRLTLHDLDALEEKQSLYKRINDTHVLIIDEVSMLHANFIDMLDKVLKHVRRSKESFGGMQVVFTGDFFQLPPVVKNLQSEGGENGVYAFTSDAWKEAKPVVCYLQEQFRQDDGALLSILEAIRKGEVDDEHYEHLKSRTGKEGKVSIKLYTHNENVDEVNRRAFDAIEGRARTFAMITRGKAHMVESLKKSILAEEELLLKVGAKVICIKNAQDKKYVNGSMGVVVDFSSDGSPVVDLVNGRRITVEADSWKIEEDGKVLAEVVQLPLKLAWAITVHKSQGMTLDSAEIDLSRTFASGQGYVALSRLRSLDGLYLKGFNHQAFRIDDVVLEMDQIFRKRSAQAEDAIQKYSKKELEKLHEKALLQRGGTLEEVDIEEDTATHTPSHEKTKKLLDDGLTLKEIAVLRGVTEATIIGHIEKLVEEGEKVDLKHVLPNKKVVTDIEKAFKKLKTEKLSPVYEHLQGKYSYEMIRLVRILQKN
jgi:hypothetical protein